MPKYMVQASYTAEGLKGLMKDTASGRKAAVKAAVKSAGGKLESMYFCLGEDDVVLVVDLPDNAAAGALVATVSSSGLVRARTTPLLTVEETDKAFAKEIGYKAPGS